MERVNTRQRRKVSIKFDNELGLTEQSKLPEANLKSILKRYETTGVLPPLRQGFYADLRAMPDYAEAQNIIAEGNSLFESLPATLRRDFDNDPAKFVDFMQDPKNKEAIEEYGFDTEYFDTATDAAPDTPSDATESPSGDADTQVDIEALIDAKIASAAKEGKSDDVG